MLWLINQVLSIHSVNKEKTERKKEREKASYLFFAQIWRWKLLSKSTEGNSGILHLDLAGRV